MKNIFKVFRKISVFILALSFLGCEDDDVVLPKVTAGFTYTVNIDTGTVTFINISDNANTYKWDFGDGTSSTFINPSKTYENGTYTIVLEAINVSGAKDTFQDEITILIPEIATVPISFDGENTKYDPEVFGGASFAVVDNPDPSGANASVSKVGEITNSGAAFEGFYFDLGMPLDLSTLKTVKALFWSNAPISVLLKLENGTGADIETTANHGGTGWEEIYFTFDSSSSYSRFTMFVDGPGTTSGKFYIDDISQIATSDIPCPQTLLELPIDFDCNSIDYATKIVGNVSFEVVDNPELSGINSAESKVGKIVNVGENWENAFFNLDTAIDFSVNNAVRFKLFSNQALPIKLKFEDGTEDPVESDVNHTGSGWEELTFNFTSTASYNDMILFVDGPGTAAGTFFIDDIEQVAGESCEAETMQSLAGADFNLTFMADPTASIIQDGATFEWIDNPDFSNDLNTSCKVGQITKLGNNPWDNNQMDLDAKLDFNANEGLKIKVWSGRPNTEVRIKLEEIGNPSNNVEKFLTTSVTSAWEELTFPFESTDSGKFDKIVLFFDLNANNTDVYYIDDLMLYGTGTGGGGGGTGGSNLLTNGDFETGTTTGWIGNAANVVTEGDNSYNFANVMTAGNPYDVNLSQVVEIIQGKSYTLSFDASSDGNRSIVAGIGLNEAPWTADTETANLTTATQMFSYNFTASFGGVNSRVLFDMGAETGVVVLDNVVLVCNDCDGGSGGGGGGGGGGTGDNLASNGDFETGTDSGWIRFQNGGTAVLDNSLSNGGNWSGKLETGGPSNPAFKQEAIGAGTVAAGNTVTVTFDHIGSTAGEGGVFNVLLFGEGAGGASFTHVFNPAPILSGAWTTFSGSFTIPGGTDVSGGISFLIETVCGGATGCSVSANIDNVSVTLN
ncbi:carbohydrate binding domain-containing protein [Aestuariivivens sediminicola]|uniref:carbohydrate binding domain-containing protein n=1 Tax=Aestuariivivens sediminicola TaxID=2913560 RepID=UPI001F594FF6|nr:carbohydrate binding domain-containing protein [Aestuariivivens sediminicola]